jgi:hypothetical protein
MLSREILLPSYSDQDLSDIYDTLVLILTGSDDPPRLHAPRGRRLGPINTKIDDSAICKHDNQHQCTNSSRLCFSHGLDRFLCPSYTTIIIHNVLQLNGPKDRDLVPYSPDEMCVIWNPCRLRLCEYGIRRCDEWSDPEIHCPPSTRRELWWCLDVPTIWREHLEEIHNKKSGISKDLFRSQFDNTCRRRDAHEPEILNTKPRVMWRWMKTHV